jgi:hypothetical protein
MSSENLQRGEKALARWVCGARLLMMVIAAQTMATPSLATDGPSGEARRAWLEKIETGRRNHQAFMARGGKPFQRPKDFYLWDSTLQPNDVIATEGGFLLFTGSANGYPHREADFRPLISADEPRLRKRLRPGR